MGRYVEHAGCLHQQTLLSSFYTGTELDLIKAKSVSDNTKYITVSTITFIWTSTEVTRLLGYIS